MRTETAVALSALKKLGSSGSHVTRLTHIHREALTHTHPPMLCSAVLILVTAEGLTTRDSTGSNQRKPDFFSAHKGTDYLLYQILHSGWGCGEKSLFQKRCGLS